MFSQVRGAVGAGGMYYPGQRWGAGVEVERALGGVGVGEQALGAGPATFAGESSTVSWQVAYAHREASMRGVAAHEVGDGEGEHA